MDEAREETKRGSRRSIRLKGYDYSQPGAYFITICTHGRECLYGEIENGEMQLNAAGEAVRFTWFDLVNHVAGIILGPFVIMPNHAHGVIEIVAVGAGSQPARMGAELRAGGGPGERAVGAERAGQGPARTGTRMGVALPEIVRQFKTFSARRVNALRKTQGVPVWQRNYWEHIIRDEPSYERIAEYILNNPRKWEEDQLYNGDKP